MTTFDPDWSTEMLVDWVFTEMPDLDAEPFDMDVAARALVGVAGAIMELRQRAFEHRSVEELRVVQTLKMEFDGLFQTVAGLKANRAYEEALSKVAEGVGPRPDGLVIPGEARVLTPAQAALAGLDGLPQHPLGFPRARRQRGDGSK